METSPNSLYYLICFLLILQSSYLLFGFKSVIKSTRLNIFFRYSKFTLGGIPGKPKHTKLSHLSWIFLIYLSLCFLDIYISAFWYLYRMKCPLASTNKRFLINTIKNTLHSSKGQEQGQKLKEDPKESEPSQSRDETKPKRDRSHPYKPSFRSMRRVSYSPPRYRNRNQHTKDKYEKQSSK